MDIAILLNKMNTSDKLRALEIIWDDLSRNQEDVPSPAWHADVLYAREKKIQDGSANFTDWSQAKRAIRDQVK